MDKPISLHLWRRIIIVLKCNSFIYNAVMHPKDADGMANSVDPDQSDTGLHYLLRSVLIMYSNVLGSFYTLFNPIILRTAKTQWSFGHSECNSVKA